VSNLQVPDNCTAVITPPPMDGCVDALVASSEEVLAVVKITGLVSAFVQVRDGRGTAHPRRSRSPWGRTMQSVGVIFAGLAFGKAPTKSDQDRLLEEEAERLNRAWTAHVGVPPPAPDPATSTKGPG
jgi:hypothetical protein